MMWLSKALVPSCSSGCLRAAKSSPASITASPFPPRHPGAYASSARCGPSRDSGRGYATVSNDGKLGCLAERLAAWPKTSRPTPYEIFNQEAKAPYSKKRFYELVKLYHPDKYGHHDEGTEPDAAEHLGGLSRAVKLERYRLVVAANKILSDPARRQDYDSCGAGWGEGVIAEEVRAWSRARDKEWRSDPNSAANNATWEDWERWYQRQNGGTGDKQAPVFMSNGGFVMVICAFAVIGIWAQAAQATTRSENMVQARDNTHHMISRDIGYRRMEQATLSKEARLQYFLKQREGWGYDGYPEHQGHLPSGSVKDGRRKYSR
ncbi:hypothetical protein RB595_007875 [Gaeumannomyces hyphopodioides]